VARGAVKMPMATGEPNDHLWTNPEDFGPSHVSDLVIIYGHLWDPPEPAK